MFCQKFSVPTCNKKKRREKFLMPLFCFILNTEQSWITAPGRELHLVQFLKASLSFLPTVGMMSFFLCLWQHTQNISTLETSTEDYVELSSTSMIKFLSFLPFLQTSVVNTFIVCLKSITCSFIYPDSPEYIKYCLIMRE